MLVGGKSVISRGEIDWKALQAVEEPFEWQDGDLVNYLRETYHGTDLLQKRQRRLCEERKKSDS